MSRLRAPKRPFWERIPSGTIGIGLVFAFVATYSYFTIIKPMNNQEELRLKQLMLRSQIDPKDLGPQGNMPEWSSPFAPKK